MVFIVEIAVVAIVALLVLAKSIVIVPEHKRYAIARLGRFQRVAGPGIIVVMPVIDRVIGRYDLSQQELRVSGEFRTGEDDKVPIEAVVRYRILDPQKAFENCASLDEALTQSVRTTIQKMAETRSEGALIDHFARQAVVHSLNEIVDNFGVRVTECELILK